MGFFYNWVISAFAETGTWGESRAGCHGKNAIAINVSNRLFPGFRGLPSSIIRHPATCRSFPKRVAPAVGDDELDILHPWLRFPSNKFVKIRVWVYDVSKPVYILRTTMSFILYVKTLIVHCFH